MWRSLRRGAALAALVCSVSSPLLADASARRITSASELITGQTAQGSVGDYVIENDFVRIVIDDIPNPHGFANTGGNVLDAAVSGGEDAFASMFTFFDNKFPRQANYDTLTIVDAGGGANVAHIRVSGVDSEQPQIAIVTDYFLGPNDRALRVVTELTNTGPEPVRQLQVGDAIQWGLTTHFAPGHDNDNRNIPGDGYDIGGLTLQVPWVAGDGFGSAYGYTVSSGDLELSNGSTWSDANVTYLDLAAGGGTGSYERYFIVGEAAISSVTDEVFALRGTSTGSISGTITEDGTGVPIADAEIVITTNQCLGTDGARSYTIARSAADGTYAAEVEPGAYEVLVKATGRTDSGCLDASVAAGSPTTIDATLSEAGTLTWSVSDGAAQPLPAKISVLYSPLTSKYEGPDLGDTHSLVGGYAILSPSGSGSAVVPPGTYEVWVSRGVEYDVHKQVVTIAAGGSANVNATLARVIDSTGYLSADLHVHALNSADSGIAYEDRASQAAAEGLEVVVPTDHDFRTDMAQAIVDAGMSPWVGTFSGNEVTTNEWGHFNGFPLTVDPDDPKGGAMDHTGLTPAQIFQTLRDDPKDPVVQINHPRAGGLGFFDIMALNPITGVSPSDDYSSDFDAVEVFNGKRLYQVDTVKNDWYRLLNSGQRLIGAGNTDTHQVFGQEIGYPRNFVELGIDDPQLLDEQAFAEAFKAGRSFLTNGPFVESWVNGQPLGSEVTDTDGEVDLRVRIQGADWVTIDTLRIVVNGVVVREEVVPVTGAVLRLDETYQIDVASDAWIAVEVTGGSCETTSDNVCVVSGCPGRLDPVVPPLYGTDPVCPFAHTNPIWVDADGNGAFDAPGNRGLLVEPIADTRGIDGAGNNTRLGEIVTVRGTATAPSYVFNHRSNTVYFQDGSFDPIRRRSGGTTIYQSGLILPEIAVGDLIEVTGTMTQFYGLTELTGVSIDVLDRERPVPEPRVTTISELRNPANDELFEGMLVRIENVEIISGTWPDFGQNANITVSDPTTSSTITMRIDQDTDIDGSPEPSTPFDLVAVVGQFKFSSPYLGFYQLLPRQQEDIVESGDPLVILHGPSSYPETACSAEIRWYTSKEGDSVVEYGPSGSYGSTVSDATPKLQHGLTLDGLMPDTEYHYRVITDGVASDDRTFTTAASVMPSLVEGPSASRVGPTTVQIVWRTDVPTSSRVEYGRTPSYGLERVVGGERTHHAVTLTGLEPGSTYHYRVGGETLVCGGGALLSEDATFDVPTNEGVFADPDFVPEVSGRDADVPFTIRKTETGGAELRFEWAGEGTAYNVWASSDVLATQTGEYDSKVCDLEQNEAGVFDTDGASFASFTFADVADLPEGFLLVVAEQAGEEGPYGFDSTGAQRASDADGSAPNELCAPAGGGCATELFFSEYVEGSSLNKAVEIYNGTGAAIDLAAGKYVIEVYFNGNTSPGTTIELTGTVADGDVYVVADDGASSAILDETDQTTTSSLWNGDDAILLFKDGVVVDAIGQRGFDPGSEWGSGSASTQNNTLRRLAAIVSGDTNPDDAFDPSLEWEGFPQDTFDGLGAHVVECP